MNGSHEVVFSPEAETDLQELYEYIRERSGTATIAIGYVRRIRAHCERLTLFPERGTRRDDIAVGLRTMGFERRATIVFRVQHDRVEVLRIHYAGRRLAPAPP